MRYAHPKVALANLMVAFRQIVTLGSGQGSITALALVVAVLLACGRSAYAALTANPAPMHLLLALTLFCAGYVWTAWSLHHMARGQLRAA